MCLVAVLVRWVWLRITLSTWTGQGDGVGLRWVWLLLLGPVAVVMKYFATNIKLIKHYNFQILNLWYILFTNIYVTSMIYKNCIPNYDIVFSIWFKDNIIVFILVFDINWATSLTPDLLIKALCFHHFKFCISRVKYEIDNCSLFSLYMNYCCNRINQ
jgi:hypothetical protein